MPGASVGPFAHNAPNDSNILEWLLRSGPAEDSNWAKSLPEPHLYPTTPMPYFDVPDEPFHDTKAELSPVPAASPSATIASDVRAMDLTSPSLPFSEI